MIKKKANSQIVILKVSSSENQGKIQICIRNKVRKKRCRRIGIVILKSVSIEKQRKIQIWRDTERESSYRRRERRYIERNTYRERNWYRKVLQTSLYRRLLTLMQNFMWRKFIQIDGNGWKFHTAFALLRRQSYKA